MRENHASPKKRPFSTDPLPEWAKTPFFDIFDSFPILERPFPNKKCSISNLECSMSYLKRAFSNKKRSISNKRCSVANMECSMSYLKCAFPNKKCPMSNLECSTSNLECAFPNKKCLIPHLECSVPYLECPKSNKERLKSMKECAIPMKECSINGRFWRNQPRREGICHPEKCARLGRIQPSAIRFGTVPLGGFTGALWHQRPERADAIEPVCVRVIKRAVVRAYPRKHGHVRPCVGAAQRATLLHRIKARGLSCRSKLLIIKSQLRISRISRFALNDQPSSNIVYKSPSKVVCHKFVTNPPHGCNVSVPRCGRN